MKVKAIKKGFYGNQLRSIGETFTLKTIDAKDGKGKTSKKLTTEATEAQFSDKWMIKA